MLRVYVSQPTAWTGRLANGDVVAVESDLSVRLLAARIAPTVLSMASHLTHISAGLLTGTLVAGAMHLHPESATLFSLSGAGASLLPDLDQPESSASHALGPGLRLPLTLFPGWRSDRWHRKFTHTSLGCAVLAVGVYLLGHVFTSSRGWLPPGWPLRIVVPALLAMLAARSILIGVGGAKVWRLSVATRHIWTLAAGIYAGYVGDHLGDTPHFALLMALAVGIGALSHVITDVPFGSGVPLLWPIPQLTKPAHGQGKEPSRPSISFRNRVSFGHFEVRGSVDHLMGWSFLIGSVVLIVVSSRLGHDITPIAHHIHV